MRNRWTTSVALSMLAASLVACGDGTGPRPGELVDVMLDFCSTETPVYFALRNEGANWTRVTPDAQGTFAFQAAERFTLAVVHQTGTTHYTEFVFATPQDVEPLSGVSCIESEGAKTLHGTVSGVPSGSAAMVSMADAFSYVLAPSSSFTLSELPNGPVDLVAHREAVGTSDVVPDRVIVRRSQDRTHNSTIPVLDFAASEAQNVAPHTFVSTGLRAGDGNHFLLTFNTATTRGHTLSTLMRFTGGAQSLYGVPGSLTQAGDHHTLEIFADGGSTYRGEVHFYRVPGNRTVALGADLNTPVLTTVSQSPHRRLRTQLQSQQEYGALVSVSHQQSQQQGQREMVLTATSAWFNGTPATWDLTIPDITGLAGFPSGAMLQGGVATDWFVEAHGGTGGAAAFFGMPADGTVLHYAGRGFATPAVQRSTTRGAGHLSPVMRRRALGGR